MDIKTPGVVTREITKFPPSIAAVETAIPAFIGYTEKADLIAPGDLINKPTRIGSLIEYELYFGVDADPKVNNVTLDDNNNFKSASLDSKFYMYNSLRLFFSNGGGNCYIVSVATYDTAGYSKDEFILDDKGIKTLEIFDEPTILVFPDNSLLENGDDFYAVYNEALLQCATLKDRFAIFHLKEDDSKGDKGFRDNLTNQNLKYGAAYTPWLTVNFSKNLTYRQFNDVLFKGYTIFKLTNLTNDTKVKSTLTEYDQLIVDSKTVNDASRDLSSPNNTLRDKFTALEGEFFKSTTVANTTALVNFLFEIARKVDVLVGAGSLTYAGIKNNLKLLITSTLKDAFSTLVSYDKELAANITNNAYKVSFNTGTVPSATEWGNTFSSALSGVSASNVTGTATTDRERMETVIRLLRPLFDIINNAWLSNVMAAVKNMEKQKHEYLRDSFPLYKSILAGLQNSNTNFPPSGAVAGLYAYIDSNRGVWKAPANVTVNSIIGPKFTFTNKELDDLNIDATAGKSINAIRSFTGKGTLVFGARTLAGNDNEWRYISVRRFYNFVEESTKKATEQFVFEPNDSHTWVRIQAMIENFLSNLWRQGALQGISPEHAFYVAVGLGKTMTPLDILEGRLIVEIGMAVVRPAEFIILSFSHIMAGS